MSSNLIRTVIAVLTVGMGLVMQVFGCSTSDVGVTTCTAAWLTPQLTAWAVMGIGFAHLVLKGLQGIAGLFNKTVPVVPPAEAKPGVVTPAQVASTGPNK